MEVAEVIAVLDRLAAVGLDFWVDGGWGVDALVGEQTRPHGDLDIVVGAEGLGRAADALAALDYAHDAAARPGLPARLVLHAGARRQVDLHPVVLDRHGNGCLRRLSGGWARGDGEHRRPPGPVPHG